VASEQGAGELARVREREPTPELALSNNEMLLAFPVPVILRSILA
jgi:hypothetical protein